MACDDLAAVQQYVSKFLVRNFGAGKKVKVHVIDKQTEATLATTLKNVAAESRFYYVEVQARTFNFEPSLVKIDGIAKPILEAVLGAQSLRLVPSEDKAALRVFFAVQFTRANWFREQFRHLPKLLAERLRRIEGDGADLSAIEDLKRIATVVILQ